MASTGEGHGGLRRNSGRKRKALTDRKEYLKEWNNTNKRICLKQRNFHPWLQAKFDAGYERVATVISLCTASTLAFTKVY